MNPSSDRLLQTAFRFINHYEGLGRLKQFLAALKKERELPLRAFRTTGNADVIFHSLVTAVSDGHLSIEQLLSFIDDLENRARQTFFLFHPDDELSASFRSLLSNAASLPSSPLAWSPTQPEHSIYRTTSFGELAIKRISPESYWAKGDESISEDGRTMSVQYHRHDVRFATIFGPIPGICFSFRALTCHKATVGTRDYRTMAGKAVRELSSELDCPITEHIRPFDLGQAFRVFLEDKKTIFIPRDQSRSSKHSVELASRREGSAGVDIRDTDEFHPEMLEYHRNLLHVVFRQNPANPEIPLEKELFVTIARKTKRFGPLEFPFPLTSVYFSRSFLEEEALYVFRRIQEAAARDA